jgi:hypothetical protein
MTPDGLQGVHITCAKSQADCLDEAAKMCPSGYVIMDQGQQQGAVAQSYYNPYLRTSTAVVTPTYTGTMLIQCRATYMPPPPQAGVGPMPPPQDQGPPPSTTAVPSPTSSSQPPAILLFKDTAGNIYRVKPEAREDAIRAGWIEIGAQ